MNHSSNYLAVVEYQRRKNKKKLPKIQCRGILKSGKRCKRMLLGSGYCSNHEDQYNFTYDKSLFKMTKDIWDRIYWITHYSDPFHFYLGELSRFLHHNIILYNKLTLKIKCRTCKLYLVTSPGNICQICKFQLARNYRMDNNDKNRFLTIKRIRVNSIMKNGLNTFCQDRTGHFTHVKIDDICFRVNFLKVYILPYVSYFPSYLEALSIVKQRFNPLVYNKIIKYL